MEQIYEIEPLLKAGACIQIHPQGYSMYPFIDPRRDEVVLAGIEDGSALRRGWYCGVATESVGRYLSGCS